MQYRPLYPGLLAVRRQPIPANDVNTTTPPLRKLRPAMLATLCALASLAPAKSEAGDGGTAMLRIVCMAPTGDNKPHLLATKGADGNWQKHATPELRQNFITGWVQVPREKLYLCKTAGGKLVPQCDFEFPGDAKRFLLVLLPGEDGGGYKAELVDPADLDFHSGETLVINSSPMAAKVKLGGESVEVKPGEISVQKPSIDEKGMYHMLVSYTDEAGKENTCHDSFASANSKSRKYLFLIADPQTGMRVSSLSEFGPFE